MASIDSDDPPSPLQRRPSLSLRNRRPSTSAPLSDLQGPVGPAFVRPKHKRTATGFGAQDIKAVESAIPDAYQTA
jgi:starch phosphorylase